MEGRDATARRARREAEAASAVRNRLEKGSPSSARRNFAVILNAMVADAAARELPGLEALAGIRKGQRQKAGFAEGFNRLHPASGAAGSLASSDARARDHWPTGETGAIEPEFLLDVARALIEAVRARRGD